ncbi:lipopolysaccharide core heptose(II) kinase RfaY, partial [Escherichia coli]|nr:lipopolysaccharide core heptose(II) kinase RfaY [Escherichia coli]EFN4745268.1 lipopolysaccharide core heptose(II) kinase RfaY [Escherichia coli]HBA5376494.1 lipopolysaccharide core heptose(II) kinase RfaY [Escherichia coli]HBH9156451.1 lipopolysaccharide core heptose(II) kinase RfaY [Escherichia coli]HCD2657855.1 lipopolysaccharide core heptose(II) kinase RfaY [Escherichia coli]
DFLTCRVKTLKVFRSIDDTKVILIDTARGPLVLKVYAPKHKMIERFLKSCVKKDYYENLIYQTDRVRGEGIQSINDYFLLAERKTLNFAHYYIMLIEYIEGVGLNEYLEISEDLKEQLSESIKELHQHGMVSGDPHKGNFIVSEKGLRLIDLSGKKTTAVLKAKDRIDLERHYNIKNELKDFGYTYLIFKKKIKKAIRDVKVKLGLKSK